MGRLREIFVCQRELFVDKSPQDKLRVAISCIKYTSATIMRLPRPSSNDLAMTEKETLSLDGRGLG
jgi:hypothetical protein